jgi:hypothetical protein
VNDLRLLLEGLADLEREARERAAEREGEAKARLRRSEWELSCVRQALEALARDEGDE